jgi:hypothetical protein
MNGLMMGEEAMIIKLTNRSSNVLKSGDISCYLPSTLAIEEGLIDS